jgi:hypothetical protein
MIAANLICVRDLLNCMLRRSINLSTATRRLHILSNTRNPWLQLAEGSFRLSLEAQDVIGLRLAKAAAGDFDAPEEAVRMVTEKSEAAWEAGWVVAQSFMSGQVHLAPARTLALYRRRVRANQRRLRGKP